MVRATTVPTTPLQIQTRRQKLMNMTGAVTSPATPHRIELRTDNNEENNCKKSFICQPPAPKARKKLLNNGDIVNGISQNGEKNYEVKESSKNNVLNNDIVNGISQNGHSQNYEVKESSKNNVTNHKVNGQHKLTEFFPVRRSVRKTKTTVLEEQQLALEKLIRNKVEDGLEVRFFDEKGRGVVAAKDFSKGDFVVEYSGQLVDIIEAKQREEMYAQNENAGCYMYYFKHNGVQYCIDATEETGQLGRLVNHSRSNPNLMTKTIMVDKKPRLVLIAKEYIKKGDEVLYDYGDRTKESLQHHPWLAY